MLGKRSPLKDLGLGGDIIKRQKLNDGSDNGVSDQNGPSDKVNGNHEEEKKGKDKGKD